MPRRAKPAPSGRSCRECIHECACVMQCGGNPMAPGNAPHCICYENLQGSNAYFLGVIAGRKEAKEAMQEGDGVMERLTFDGNFCDIAQCRELPCRYNTACTQRQVWEKLKAYEDLGLDPEEYERDLSADIMVRVAAGALGVPAEALRDMVELWKAGRLMVLPEEGKSNG